MRRPTTAWAGALGAFGCTLAIPETPLTKGIVAGICTYEVAALATGLCPTVTALTRRHPVLGVVLIGALALHFWAPTPLPSRCKLTTLEA